MSDESKRNSRSLSDRCRTVVVSGVPDELTSSRMNDKLTIHFQSARSNGGDVEMVQYPTHLKGVAFVTFDNWRDADRVVEVNQVLRDKEFKEEYPLTVYTYTPEVAFYAYADVDVSPYPDLSALIASLRSNHRSVRIQPSLNKSGFVSAEGPFSALQELRKDLLSQHQNRRDILNDASSLYKVSSLDKASGTYKSLSMDKASNLDMPWALEKAPNLDKVRSQDIALSLDKPWSPEKALGLDKASSSDKAGSLDKTLRSDKVRSQDKPSSLDRALSQDRVSSLDKTRTQDRALSLDKTWSQDGASYLDKGGHTKVEVRNMPNGTNSIKFWLDTLIYKYMQIVERDEWDRCVHRYNVTYQAVSTGEVTEVELQGTCDESVLSTAQTELEILVAEKQGSLRTHHIDCSSTDLTMKMLLQVCESAHRIYTDVCYFLSDSYVEVIGPSFSSHMFCEWVRSFTEKAY